MKKKAKRDKGELVQVKALMLGYYGDRRRREGEIFVCGRNEVSKKWMRVLREKPAEEPEFEDDDEDAFEDEGAAEVAPAAPVVESNEVQKEDDEEVI